MSVARDEMFGPVLCVMSFADEADALRIANGTPYGLASAVWTGNLAQAHRVRAGIVHVNTHGGADNTVPLGGVKQAGKGQDKSLQRSTNTPI